MRDVSRLHINEKVNSKKSRNWKESGNIKTRKPSAKKIGGKDAS